jgi:large subunit ribosomal protein L6
LSRIGKNPIIVPQGIKVSLNPEEIMIQGPKGKISRKIPEGIKVNLEDNKILVTRSSENKFYKSLHGLTRALIANMVQGTSSGFKKNLQIVGVGYKAELIGEKLNLSLGFSHPILFVPPEGIKIELESPIKIIISGIDKEIVGLVADKIRSFRPPEPYKGKGVRYENEKVRKKAGKTTT